MKFLFQVLCSSPMDEHFGTFSDTFWFFVNKYLNCYCKMSMNIDENWNWIERTTNWKHFSNRHPQLCRLNTKKKKLYANSNGKFWNNFYHRWFSAFTVSMCFPITESKRYPIQFASLITMQMILIISRIAIHEISANECSFFFLLNFEKKMLF